jgi:hypothetical protein
MLRKLKTFKPGIRIENITLSSTSLAILFGLTHLISQPLAHPRNSIGNNLDCSKYLILGVEFVHGFVGQPGGLRWQSAALQCIQEAAEAYLVHLFEDT